MLKMAPRQEQVDALFGNEFPVSDKSQRLVPEDELGLRGIDVTAPVVVRQPSSSWTG